MSSFLNKFFNLPKLNQEEKEFIIRSFHNEVHGLITPVIIVIASIQAFLTMYIDYSVFGYQHLWLFIKILYLPYILTVYWIWKKFLSKNDHYILLPAVFSILYIGAYLSYFISVTSPQHSPYHHGVLEIFIAITFFPLLVRTYLILFFGTIIYTYSIIYISAKDALVQMYPAIISNHLPSYLFTVFLFFVIWKIRVEKARLEYKVMIDLKNQAETIKNQSEELARAKVFEAVAETVQMVAHDVRKPFLMIKSTLKMLRSELSSPHSLELYKIASQNIDSSLKKVNGTLLDIMHAGQKSKSLNRENLNIIKLLEGICHDIEKIFDFKKFSLNLDIANTELNCYLDENKIGRAIFNILDNAVQAISEKGCIIVKIHSEDKNVAIFINNNGPIIPHEALIKIFDPMFTTGKKSGTGLGLHIAKIFISEHDGKISCTSDIDSGTTFKIVLPRVKVS